MKKIKFTNLKTGNDFSKDCATQEEELQYIEWCKTLQCIGKPEREIIELSESYDEADVLSRRSESVGEGVVNYVTLRAEYEITEEDITEAYNAEQALMLDIQNGERAERACKQIKQYVTGYNMRRSLTSEQVSSFVSTFASIQVALDSNRPNTTRSLIEAVPTDTEVVPQNLKDNCLLILTRNGF